MSTEMGPKFSYLNSEEIVNRINGEIRKFRFAVFVSILITMIPIVLIYFAPMAVAILFLIAAFIGTFCCIVIHQLDQTNTSVEFLTVLFKKKQWWILYQSYVFVHNRIQDWDDLNNIPAYDRIAVSESVHIMRNEASAVALRLVI